MWWQTPKPCLQAAVTRATGNRTGGSLGAEAQQMAAINLRDEQRAAHEEKLAAPGSPKKARTAPGARGAHQHHTLGQLLRVRKSMACISQGRRISGDSCFVFSL
jgi:hypothetical protein